MLGMSSSPVIVWFRNDLRIADNPALHLAVLSGNPVLGLYVLDDALSYSPTGAARWWLHHSLTELQHALASVGVPLILRRGPTIDVIRSICKEADAGAIYWNRRYFADHIQLEEKLERKLKRDGVITSNFNGALLRDPWEVKTKEGGHYRVFTPFWRKLQEIGPVRSSALPAVKKQAHAAPQIKSNRLRDWNLTPQSPDWASEFDNMWTPGEAGAHRAFDTFLSSGLKDYAEKRDRPDCVATSQLSPHLAFGEISPIQIWTEVAKRQIAGDISAKNADKFLSEVAWREFSYNLLYHHKDLVDKPLRKEFGEFPWLKDQQGFNAWIKGKTGYPIIDAGMRQLWRTGWMHNRVRMITASFLVKDLLIHWRRGEAWFRDTLVDIDIASNAANWQWVAGCGADAAPYFRIFNPILQGKKFDPEGVYVREFVPELKNLPDRYIHEPWTAPAEILNAADIVLGGNYPYPIVDHAFARDRALECYASLKQT